MHGSTRDANPQEGATVVRWPVDPIRRTAAGREPRWAA